MTGSRPVTPAELAVVLEGIRQRSPYAHRDRLLVGLIAYAGLRMGEALALDVGDLVDGRAVRAVLELPRHASKGKRTGRQVAIAPPLAALVSAELLGHNPLFVDRDRPALVAWGAAPAWPVYPRLSRAQAQRICRDALACLAAPIPTSHGLRKYFAGQLRAAGATLDEVADLLGHADVRTTRRYLALDRERLAALVHTAAEGGPDAAAPSTAER